MFGIVYFGLGSLIINLGVYYNKLKNINCHHETCSIEVIKVNETCNKDLFFLFTIYALLHNYII